MAVSLQETTGFGATDGVFILTYCATGENDAVDVSRAECTLPYKGIQDVVFYSNRDGSFTKAMVQGPMQHLFDNLKTFWPLPERPVYGLNDRLIQKAAACIAADLDTNENTLYNCNDGDGGFSRASSDMGATIGLGKAAWKHFRVSLLTSNAANTSW